MGNCAAMKDDPSDSIEACILLFLSNPFSDPFEE